MDWVQQKPFVQFSEEFKDVYDFEIDSEGHAMEGYLFPDVESGDRVQVNLEEGELLMENGKEVKYIRLKIRKSKNNSVRFRFYFGCCLDI